MNSDGTVTRVNTAGVGTTHDAVATGADTNTPLLTTVGVGIVHVAIAGAGCAVTDAETVAAGTVQADVATGAVRVIVASTTGV